MNMKIIIEIRASIPEIIYKISFVLLITLMKSMSNLGILHCFSHSDMGTPFLSGTHFEPYLFFSHLYN